MLLEKANRSPIKEDASEPQHNSQHNLSIQQEFGVKYFISERKQVPTQIDVP